METGIPALTPGADPPAAVLASGRPAAQAREQPQPSEDCRALRAEVERQREELDCRRSMIEQLRQKLEQSEAAGAARSALLAELSHELRTPLNAIIGFSEIIQSQSLGPIGNATYRDYIGEIIFCGRHLLDLVDATLEIARHEAGTLELQEEPVAVGEVIDDALRLIAPLADRAGVRYFWRPGTSELPLLYCDRLRVRQILLNILSNAVKFTEAGGQVEIAADLSDGLALLVSDTGIGVAPENIALALSRFGRIEANGPPHRAGAGLGLSLAKALTEQHGGSLLLHSTPRIGTMVRIWFPARRLVPGNSGAAAEALPPADTLAG